VFSATEPVPEGSSGILVESIFEGMAEAYSAELSEKVTDGMKRNAKNGTVNGGYRLFGYDIVEKRYVINTYEAEIVKRVFEKYANGDTARSIIEHCCKRGYKTPQATDFGYNFLNRMLKNKKIHWVIFLG
jgi:DNA invertase Pin-like site-specific DNA recombinase